MWYCVSLLIFLLYVAECLEKPANGTNGTMSPPTTTTTTTTTTLVKLHSPGINFWNIHMMWRAFYVLIGISLLAVLYFVIRAVSLKKKPIRKKYGLLSNYDENMEMGSMDSDEEQIYEARSIRR